MLRRLSSVSASAAMRSVSRSTVQKQLPSFMTSTRSSHGIVQHRPSPDNPETGKFEFTEENKKIIKETLAKYPDSYKRSGVIPLLYLVQEQNNNWVPLAAMNKIAELLDVAPIRVYEVATFYTMFNRTPVGKYHLQLCGTTPCQLCGAEKIRETIEKHLNIHEGDTTPDKMFTLTEVECLGACVNAPMLQINNKEFYENLTPENTIKLLDNLRAGNTVKVGPQNHQKDCEGAMGRTTLKDVASIKPVCRDLAEVKRQAEEKAKADAAAKAAAAAAAAAGAPPAGAAPAGGATPPPAGAPPAGGAAAPKK